jgi:hypothetical protein
MRRRAVAGDAPVPAAILAEMDDLERRRRLAAAELRKIAAERASLARAVAGGDKLAVARVEWLNNKSGELAVEIDCLASVKDAARERLGEVLEARQRGPGPVGRQPDPFAVKTALLAQSRRVDALMGALFAALAGRAALVRRLTTRGGRAHPQLANPARVMAAAGYHGLGDYLDLGPHPERLRARLGDADELALRGLLPAPAAAEREFA